MSEVIEIIVRSVLIGAGATLVLDIWSLIAPRFGFQAANWAMVGRWIAGLPQGRFARVDLATSPVVPGEAVIGWTAHYAIGIFYALLLVLIIGLGWARQPTPLPAFIIGYLAMGAPLFVMQPGMGRGIASANTPDPWKARLGTLLSHTAFSLGLWVSAWVVA